MPAGVGAQPASAAVQNGSPRLAVKEESSVSNKVDGGYPPSLPHVTDNRTPLSDALRRQAQYTYRELSTFMKSLESSSVSDNEKKRKFLDLLVSLRENFIRLYVISKWARDATEIQKLIDLFAWLRDQGQAITNALGQLGNMKQSLVSAKVPNPDISTALEVLVQGRPQLPTHSFLPAEKVPQELILDTLRRLDIAISVKMALATNQDLPRQFYNYEVRDGRVIMDVHGSFECALSLASDAAPGAGSLSELPFCLVDFKLGFRTENLKIVLSKTALPQQTFVHLERVANMELARGGLVGLYELLHEYALSCKLFMLHRQLLKLRMGLWRGHLSHSYSAERGIIVISYWLKRRGASSRIEIGRVRAAEGEKMEKGGVRDGVKSGVRDGVKNGVKGGVKNAVNDAVKNTVNNSPNGIQNSVDAVNNDTKRIKTPGTACGSTLGLRWVRENKACDLRGVELGGADGSIDVERVIRQIIGIHIDDELKELRSKLVASIENAERFCHIQQHDLVFDVNHRRTVIYNISLLSGQGYFQHPTPGMARVVSQINRNPADNAFVGLLRLRLLTQDQDLGTVLSATGWAPVPGIQMSLQESGLDADLSQLKNASLAPQLAAVRFFARNGWPRGFFLAAAVFGFSTRPQFWICQLSSCQGCWKVLWAGSVHLPPKIDQSQQFSFAGLDHLAGICTSKLVCHLIVNELREMHCNVKRLHPETDRAAADFVRRVAGGTVDRRDASQSVLLLGNRSLFAIPGVRDSLLLVASIDASSTLRVAVHGRLCDTSRLGTLAHSLNGISSISGLASHSTSVNLDQDTRIFTIRSTMNLKERWLSHDRANSASDTPPGSLSDPDDAPALASTILAAPLTVLRQLSGLLSLFQLVGSDPQLKLRAVTLDKVCFQYGENANESITLKLKPRTAIPDTPDADLPRGLGSSNESVSIELADGNPHLLCVPRLKQLVSAGFNYEKIRMLIVYLMLTLPLYRVHASLLKLRNDQLDRFNEKNADPAVPVSKMQMFPSLGFTLSLYQMEMMRILYYKLIAKKGDKKQKLQRLVCGLGIQLKHRHNRMSLNGSVYLITLSSPLDSTSSNSPSSQSTSSSTISDSSDLSVHTALMGISRFMNQYFSGEKQIPVKSSASDGELPVVYLKTGLVCKSVYLEQIVNFLHAKMLEAFAD